jgi:hypothetical protein
MPRVQGKAGGTPARRKVATPARAPKPGAATVLDGAALFAACIARLVAVRGAITGSVRRELVEALHAMPSMRAVADPLAADADGRRLATALREMASKRKYGPEAVRRFAVIGTWATTLEAVRREVTGPASDAEAYRQSVAFGVARFLSGSGRRATPIVEVQACVSHLLDPGGTHFDWKVAPTPVTVVVEVSKAKTDPRVAPIVATPDADVVSTVQNVASESDRVSAPVDLRVDDLVVDQPEAPELGGDPAQVAETNASPIGPDGDAMAADGSGATPDLTAHTGDGTPPVHTVPTSAVVATETHLIIAAALASRGHFADAIDTLRGAGPVDPIVGGLLEALDARLHFDIPLARARLRRIVVPVASSPLRDEVHLLGAELDALDGPTILQATPACLAELFWNADLARRQRRLVDFLGRVSSLQEIAVRWVVEDYVEVPLRSKSSNADLNAILGQPEHARLQSIVHGRLGWRMEKRASRVPFLTGRAGLSVMFGAIIVLLGDAVNQAPDADARLAAAVRQANLEGAWEHAMHLDGVKELRNRTIIGHDMARVSVDEIDAAHLYSYRDRPAGHVGVEGVIETCRLLLLHLGVEVGGVNPFAMWGARLANVVGP